MLDRGKILTVSIILISIVLFSVIYLTKKNTNSQSEGNKLLQFEDNIDHYTSVAESLWNHSDYFEWLYDETDIEFNEIVKSFNESQEWLDNYNKLMKKYENLEI